VSTDPLHIINDVLWLSKIKSGGSELRRSILSFADAIAPGTVLARPPG
jgi:hypothetical protein